MLNIQYTSCSDGTSGQELVYSSPYGSSYNWQALIDELVMLRNELDSFRASSFMQEQLIGDLRNQIEIIKKMF